jgi:predicted RNA-binding Zn-ribbon protein involved in translation (DUF1610 family)
MSIPRANQRVETNRRPAFTFHSERQFERASFARRCLSAAVAHPYRSGKNKMTKCPHCGAEYRPLKIFLWWKPYECPECKKRSRFNQTLINLWACAFGATWGVAIGFFEWRQLILIFILLTLIYVLIPSFLFHLQPCEPQKEPEQGTGGNAI